LKFRVSVEALEHCWVTRNKKVMYRSFVTNSYYNIGGVSAAMNARHDAPRTQRERRGSSLVTGVQGVAR
jgi:hypothetical protein